MENIIFLIMLVFAIIGLIDRLFNNKIGLGAEFEKGINLLGPLVLTMVGMIVLAPFIADVMNPVFGVVYRVFGIDASTITSCAFANDMGGAQLAHAVAKNEALGYFNGLVVGSMMGATVSFTIPFAVGFLKKERQKEFMLGLMCGIVTVPVGTVAGLIISGIPFKAALINLIPLSVFAIILGIGVFLLPNFCIKIFKGFGVFIKFLVSFGLALGLIKFLTGYELIKGIGTFEEGATICLKSAIALSGAFPILFIVSKLLLKPMKTLGRRFDLNEKSMLGFVSSLASNITTFEMMEDMDKKGAVLNSAFAVSASFLIADHLAFTLAFNSKFLVAVMVSKIISGATAILFASFIYKRVGKTVLEQE